MSGLIRAFRSHFASSVGTGTTSVKEDIRRILAMTSVVRGRTCAPRREALVSSILCGELGAGGVGLRYSMAIGCYANIVRLRCPSGVSRCGCCCGACHYRKLPTNPVYGPNVRSVGTTLRPSSASCLCFMVGARPPCSSTFSTSCSRRVRGYAEVNCATGWCVRRRRVASRCEGDQRAHWTSRKTWSLAKDAYLGTQARPPNYFRVKTHKNITQRKWFDHSHKTLQHAT